MEGGCSNVLATFKAVLLTELERRALTWSKDAQTQGRPLPHLRQEFRPAHRARRPGKLGKSTDSFRAAPGSPAPISRQVTVRAWVTAFTTGVDLMEDRWQASGRLAPPPSGHFQEGTGARGRPRRLQPALDAIARNDEPKIVRGIVARGGGRPCSIGHCSRPLAGRPVVPQPARPPVIFSFRSTNLSPEYDMHQNLTTPTADTNIPKPEKQSATPAVKAEMASSN